MDDAPPDPLAEAKRRLAELDRLSEIRKSTTRNYDELRNSLDRLDADAARGDTDAHRPQHMPDRSQSWPESQRIDVQQEAANRMARRNAEELNADRQTDDDDARHKTEASRALDPSQDQSLGRSAEASDDPGREITDSKAVRKTPENYREAAKEVTDREGPSQSIDSSRGGQEI